MTEPIAGANRVGGAWGGSESAGRFTVRAPREGFQAVGSYPVSDEADVERALSSLVPCEWARASGEERVERLAEAARLLEARPEPPVASSLGLEPEEGARLRSGFVEGLGRALGARPAPASGSGRAGGPGTGPRGWVLWVAHWTELERPLFEALVPELLAGAPVLLLADRRLPAGPESVARALVETGVGGRRLSLLHAPTPDALDHALSHPAVEKVVATGSRRRIAHIRRATPEVRAQELTVVRNAGFEVDADGDLAEQARELVRAAFGRTETLGGQAAGQAARVHCPETVLSRFTELLLEACDESRDVRDPLPQIDRDAVRVFERRLALGLDEGATLIQGAVLDANARLCAPAVFTNVEPGMELWREPRPVPACLLSRTG